MRESYDKKLWYQLSVTLENLVQHPYFSKGDELIQLYDKFIKDFEIKMNQLQFVRIILHIAKQFQTDNNAAFNFLNKISEKINPKVDKEASSLILSEMARLKLELGQPDESKPILDKVEGILETITGGDHFTYSRYYRALSLYYKSRVAPPEFYKNTFLFLVYTPLETIPIAEQQSLAFDLGIAALVAQEIYNFGELLAHPILNSLQKTRAEWLIHFLFSFNSGDIQKFESILAGSRAEVEAQPALTANYNLLREKICILSLMELVFNRPSDERTLPFKLIADATKLQVDQVELLVMKSLSLKLIKGFIDEVSQTVTVTWVQPRVLDSNQVTKMKDRIFKWTGDVHQMVLVLENEIGTELLA